MEKITISVPLKLEKWVRARVVKSGMNVSDLVESLLRDEMEREKRSDVAAREHAP